MKLNRRNVLAGLGTAAAGTAAVFGTGAFVQETVSRDFVVTITNEDDEAVQLPIEPTRLDTNDRVSIADNDGVDTLTVDATNLPQDATVTLGDFSDNSDSSTMNQGAFTVTNNNAINADINLEVGLTTADNSTVELAVDDGSGPVVVSEGGSQTISNLSNGEVVDVGIWIDTASSNEPEQIDITLTATEA